MDIDNMPIEFAYDNACENQMKTIKVLPILWQRMKMLYLLVLII